MGGVSTAAPVDAIGAVYWNPAGPGRLESNEIGIGGEMIIPDINVSSALPGGPTGTTRSDSGVGLLSDLGWLYHVNEQMTASLGILTLAGGGVTLPGDAANPIFAPTGPNGNIVFGPQHSSMTIVQLLPTLSMSVTEKLTVGIGPTISAAIVSFTPAFFAGPNDANGDGLFSFPDGSNTRPYWGGGFRAGAIYSLTSTVDVGFSYSSPTWFETWKFYSADEVGNAQTLRLNANLPAIYSWGVAYRGIERLLLAVDLRYIDYRNTDLFGERFIDSGLNWSSVFVTAVGSRYQLTDRIALMAGYIYNQNPVPDVGTFFNIQAPGITKHSVSVGTSMDITDSITASLAYVHAFHNTVSGSPAEAAGADVTIGTEADSIVIGLYTRFGGSARKTCGTSVCTEVSMESTPTTEAPPAESEASETVETATIVQ
jgi:long-chain fatty acid transport protein